MRKTPEDSMDPKPIVCPACGSPATSMIGWTHCTNEKCTWGPRFWSPPLEPSAWTPTARDYFAAKALQGFIANEMLMKAAASGGPPEMGTYVARAAYEFSDAMLKARNE